MISQLSAQLAELEVYSTPATHTNMMDYLNDQHTVVILVTTEGQAHFYIALVPMGVMSGVTVVFAGDFQSQITGDDIMRFLNWLTHNRQFRCEAFITSYQGRKQ